MASTGTGTAYRHLCDLFEAGSVVGLDDGHLLARYARSKDEAAFEALVGRHGPMVLATCRAVLRNEQDVEDAFQATFLVLARKAGSIRETDALGGWLHRVAYRTSVQAAIEAARRRVKEAASAHRPRPAPAPSDLDALASLHLEIDRLPSSERLAVVLCDLEGLTYDQAAARLRWTAPTLRHRLARGRQRLKARLIGRGLAPLALGAALASTASANVPPALARVVVDAALGGMTSPWAASLARTIGRVLAAGRIKSASAVLLAVASAVVLGSGVGSPPPVAPPAAKPRGADGAVRGPVGEIVEIPGLVVSPQGRPVSGATVRALYVDQTPKPEATSGPEGRFVLRIARAPGIRPEAEERRRPWVVASAPASGFGPGWAGDALRATPARPLLIRLAEAGPTIEGRVLDLEGRGVGGASVEVEQTYFPRDGNLDAWIAGASDPRTTDPWAGLVPIPTPRRVATAPDGSFRLDGIGRDRVARLRIAGPTLAASQAYVIAREGPEIRSHYPQERSTVVFHAPRFAHLAAPAQAIEGVARDQDHGGPIAGLSILVAVDRKGVLSFEPGISAVTDKQGRYRLSGLNGAAAYQVFVRPGQGVPYPQAMLRASGNSIVPGPLPFDFELRRGVVVRGRVTDKVTGRGVTGSVEAFTFRDQPSIHDVPGFAYLRPARAVLKDDGSYEVVVPPGRSLIACQSDDGRYRANIGSGSIAGLDPETREFNTWPWPCRPENYHVVAEINAIPRAGPTTLDLQADPGRSLAIAVVDPDGRPLTGLTSEGTGDLYRYLHVPEPSSTVEVRGLAPSEPRRVIVAHEGRKLIGSVWLEGHEVGPLTLRLEPWGSVVGRVVAEQEPERFRFLWDGVGDNMMRKSRTVGTLTYSSTLRGYPIGKDGRFRVEGLVPGLRYWAIGSDGEQGLGGYIFQRVAVESGQVRDLGTIRITP